MDKIVERYSPSSYTASGHNVSFGDSVTVTSVMSSAPRYDTVYYYRPSSYSASSYTAERHSYSASSARQVTQTLYVKSGSNYTEYPYTCYVNYSASSHSYTPSSYSESSYSASELITKKLTDNYTPSEYTKSSLTVRPVDINLGTFTTRNITALTT